MIASILLREGVLVKYIVSSPFRKMKKARSLLQNFGRCNAKKADKFLRTCLPFKAVILLYGSSNLSAKQKRAFYIYEYASPNPGVWAAKNPDKIGVFAEHIFFMFLLWNLLLYPAELRAGIRERQNRSPYYNTIKALRLL